MWWTSASPLDGVPVTTAPRTAWDVMTREPLTTAVDDLLAMADRDAGWRVIG